MTAPTAGPPEVRVTPDTIDARLSQLLTLYEQAAEQVDIATERFDQIRDGIKAGLQNLHPLAERFHVEHPELSAPLTLRRTESLGIDVKRLRADAGDNRELALLLARYAKTSVRWTLARARGGAA